MNLPSLRQPTFGVSKHSYQTLEENDVWLKRTVFVVDSENSISVEQKVVAHSPDKAVISLYFSGPRWYFDSDEVVPDMMSILSKYEPLSVVFLADDIFHKVYGSWIVEDGKVRMIRQHEDIAFAPQFRKFSQSIVTIEVEDVPGSSAFSKLCAIHSFIIFKENRLIRPIKSVLELIQHLYSLPFVSRDECIF